MTDENPYQPWIAKIISIKEEASGERAIKTFRLEFQDEEVKKKFTFLPGQCIMVSVFGTGESMFAISSSPTQKDYIEVSVMRYGKLTKALHLKEEGELVGARGPYGNSFKLEEWKGKNILFLGGGIGQAPLRSVIDYCKDNRKDYGKIDIVYGARTSRDLCYKDEFAEMSKKDDLSIHLSIDVEEEGWDQFVGFVPDNLKRLNPSPENTIAITCGPPIMIKFVIQNLLELGFKEDQVYTTLEMRMKCGIGICGRCNIGNLYVCKDGPVFSYDQIKDIQGDM
ncbi:MAG: FAD/NAD(P)-binding protein [Candidatus Heimdallarchaeota archaeon]|nr:heterodisulfide reductase subunit F [Candidatus Heimdallarchaeota archaeon]MCG3257095.1 FAD/NAD(P)-binding protein [Candidatus Heimdallarchaeota archaeon]MCK4612155.1 FAD/NAD(P)-binding protein [Candidatus Heimdallarchaeota archaeon]